TSACAPGAVNTATVVVLPIAAKAAPVVMASAAAAPSSLIKARISIPPLSLILTQAGRAAKGLSRLIHVSESASCLALHVDPRLGEPAGVGANRDHVPAGGNQRLRIIDVIGKNQSHDGHFAAFTQDQGHRLFDFLGVDIKAAGQRHREVVRPEADHVHAVEREDFVELVERALRFNLRASDGPVVGGGEIVPLVVEPRTIGTPTPVAAWRKLYG